MISVSLLRNKNYSPKTGISMYNIFESYPEDPKQKKKHLNEMDPDIADAKFYYDDFVSK